MTDREFDLFLQGCRDELREIISASKRDWGLGSFSRFDFDQDKGELTFSGGLAGPLSCKVQIIGTYSGAAQTWEWAWNNPYVDDKLKIDSSTVREFGIKHGIQRLTTATWPARENDGWDMTAIAAHVCGCQGVYRMPSEQIIVFMLLKQISRPEKVT